MSPTTTHRSTAGTVAVPTDAVLSSLQDILDAWEKGSFEKVIQECTALLKRRKAMNSHGLVEPLQRLWFQSLLQQAAFEKLISTVDLVKGPTDLDTPAHLQDLILYARYRLGEYAAVSKQAQKTASSSAASGTKHTPSSLVAQHLVLQSQFHLNQTQSVLTGYREILEELENDDDDEQQDGANHVERLQVLTNALAAIASSTTSLVPYVATGNSNSVGEENEEEGDDNISFLMNEAQHLLEDEIQETADVVRSFGSIASDLSNNLGILHFLTDQSSPTTDWLQISDDMAGKNDTNIEIKTNLAWRRHFWYRDVDDVTYPTTGTTSSATAKMTVPQSVAKTNQAILHEQLRNLPSQPHPKWNPLQIRMYWYNRAVLQCKAKQYVECQESCQSLKKFIVSSLASGSNAGANNRKKKNKAGNPSAAASDTTSADTEKGKFSSSSSSDMWWESRIDVVLAHVQHGQSKAKEALTRLDDRLGQLRSASSGSSGNHILDYSTAYVQLHRFIIEHDLFSNHKTSKKTQQLLEVLKALPSSIRSRPAVKLTLNDLETFLATRASSAGSSGSAKEATPLEQADIAFSQGKYQIACDLYEQNLPVDTSRQDDEASDRQLRYIQALTLTGQFEKAAELGQSLSSELDGTEASSSPDGLTLESKGLPRNMKAVVAKHLVPVANEATDEITSPQNPVKEKIMRRRARKREQYLKQLEEKGLYNPDRPTKPDPERWIPKHERSRSRGGGNRNRNSTGNNRSAQGGGSQRDALKLDAAARKAGIVPVSTGPSTASIQVSSGRKAGRRR